MKKVIICICFFLLLWSRHVYAADYDIILGDCVKNIGIFKNGEGMVYAGTATFEGRELLAIVYLDDNAIKCDLYSTEDGQEKIDGVSFAYGGNNAYILSLGTVGGGEGCIVLDTNGKREVFIMQADTLKRIYDAAVYDEDVIVSCDGTGIVCEKNPADIYDFLNSEKEKKISQSAFSDVVNKIETQKLNNIHEFLNAISDVIEFDSENVDYVRILKNILYTSEKYENLTDTHRDYRKNSQEAGFEKIQSVSGEYIDRILTAVFGVEPQHLSVNNLIENDVCYTNGRYFFVGGYTNIFNTHIERIETVYDLGGGRYYIIFFDEYSEGGLYVPEFSYAVIDTNAEVYKLIRLSMGGNLLSDAEIKEYSLVAKQDGLFFKDGDDFLFLEKRQYAIKILIGVSIVAVCLAIMALVFGFVLRRSK